MVDDVYNIDSTAHEDAETARHQHQPEAPAEVEHEDGLLQSDEEGPGGKQPEVDEVAEEKREACQGDQVGAVSRNNDQHQVGQNPSKRIWRCSTPPLGNFYPSRIPQRPL